MRRPAEIWSHLRETSDDTPGWHFRRLSSVDAAGLLAGIRKPGNIPGLILEVPATAVSRHIKYPKSHGFLLWPEFVGSGSDGIVRLYLELSEPSFENVFSVLAEDVSDALETASIAECALKKLLDRLRVWQSFMRRYEQGGLGRNGTIGLYGEVAAIEMLLSSNIGPGELIAAWQGPARGLWDFQFRDTVIEVKTTSRLPPDTLTVSALAQLDDTSVRSMFILHVQLQEMDSRGRNLNQIVETVDRIIERTDPAALPSWRDHLIQAGHLKDADLAEDLVFQIVSVTAHLVQGDFPRITPRDVRPGIVDCQYQIQTAAVQPYTVHMDSLLTELKAHGNV